MRRNAVRPRLVRGSNKTCTFDCNVDVSRESGDRHRRKEGNGGSGESNTLDIRSECSGQMLLSRF